MKNLIVAALLMFGMTSFAQEGKPMKTVEQREQLTTEQRNEMQLKRMAAELNLDANQQQEMLRIIQDRSAKREMAQKERAEKKQNGEKPTAEDLQKRRAEMQEYNEAEKAKIKKLLTAEQFTKWEQMNAERKEKAKQAAAAKPQK